jgi:hypothetical protein
MAYGVVNADKMTTSDGVSSSGLYGFKNRLINSAMVIDQRNAGGTLNPTNAALAYAIDRFFCYNSTASSKFSIQQSSTAPTGFSKSVLVTSSSAYSVAAGDQFYFGQLIEGFNTADLGFGTASASTVTLSFWVRSSLTGTFGGSLMNSAYNRSYPFSYTISSANTWEQKSVTIAGDTSGTWIGATNGTGLRVHFGLGVGSTLSGTANAWAGAEYYSATGATSVVGTNGATFYITGVQLEKGSTATSFDYRPYTTELQLCQRYLPAFTAISGTNGPLPGMGTALGTNCVLIFNHPVPARVPGTGVVVSSNSHFNFSNNDGNSASTAVSFAAGSPSVTQVSITVAVTRGVTTTPGWFYANNASAYLYVTGCEL